MDWGRAPASSLRARFEVSGRFYAWSAGHRCRDELEIRAIGTRANGAVDAVFVMAWLADMAARLR
jgi:hypothetical protein